MNHSRFSRSYPGIPSSNRPIDPPVSYRFPPPLTGGTQRPIYRRLSLTTQPGHIPGHARAHTRLFRDT